MKKFYLFFIFACCCLNTFSQATSITVDCQTPGWLSSMINYGDQQTLKNIKVTGYINGTDLQFILDLNKQRSLTGIIDLEYASLVSGGTLEDYPHTVKKDNVLPYDLFRGGRRIQKLVLPNTLISSVGTGGTGITGDSVIWTSLNEKEIMVSYEIGTGFDYISIPEGIETISNIPDDISIVFPSTIKKVGNYGVNHNLKIFSFIENPEQVYAQSEDYYSDAYGGHRSFWAAIAKSTFYIPKGTKEKYLKSDFGEMKEQYSVNGNIYGRDNENIFIEYYDVEKTEVNPEMTLYKGESKSLDVTILPDANLVSWINYSSSNSDIVSVDSEGNILANDYGQADVSATPHIFIDGLETKTGVCHVKVIAHTEGLDVPSTFSVHIGEEKTLEAKTLPLDYSDNQIVFESSDPTIAFVNEDGTVIGKAKGTCTITATSVDGGFTATCEVTVLQPVEAATLETHGMEMKVGDNKDLYCNLQPATADNKAIVWQSSDEYIATVDNSGSVTALKAGTVYIRAISEDNSEAKDSCKVTVLQPVKGITLNYSTYEVNAIGESFVLEATISPEDASNKEIKWTSSDESVCIVSNGTVVVTGFGTCVIIASTNDGNYIATCTINSVSTGIKTINSKDASFDVYGINGVSRKTLRKGMNIIRMSDGSVKKVVVK